MIIFATISVVDLSGGDRKWREFKRATWRREGSLRRFLFYSVECMTSNFTLVHKVTNKYHGLKAKVRRYQRHCEAKEEHYRGEYSRWDNHIFFLQSRNAALTSCICEFFSFCRLESEFRSTLETLKGRMEVAYSAKEQQVFLILQ